MSAGLKFSTHGCRLNTFETAAMEKMAQDAGLSDAVVVNSCAVTAEAVRKAKQDIRRLRRDNPKATLVVTGCAAQTAADDFTAMAEVDVVLGNEAKMRAESWSRLAAGGADQNAFPPDAIMEAKTLPKPPVDGFGTRARAYVQVQNGCDHRCTFCIIPYGRGNSRSVPAEDVIAQTQRLVAKGYNEIVLTGVDMTSWGKDLTGTPQLGALVRRLLRAVPELPRLRLSSIDSIEADPDLLRAMAEEERLMPYLHLSLQAGADIILKRMKRRHLRADSIAFCAELRRLRPDIAFGADIIAGFPTEREEDFQQSLDLVEECGLSFLHVFPYSARPGTPAARMPQLDGPTIKARAARLRAAGEAALNRHHAREIGQHRQVLMESAHRGRTPQFAQIALDQPAAPGRLIWARINGAENGQLRGSTSSSDIRPA